MSYARGSLQHQRAPKISWLPWWHADGVRDDYDDLSVYQHFAGWLFWQWRWYTVK